MSRGRCSRLSVASTFFLAVAARSAHAESSAAIYSGTSFTRDSDLHVSQPSLGTEVVFRDVSWEPDPWKPAPYYGFRFAHFFESHSRFGVALDYTHYKMYAETAQVVPLTGTWRGAVVSGEAPVDARVQRFELSHGVNMLGIEALYRFGQDGLRPYAGAGLVHYWHYPHAVVDAVVSLGGYQPSGFGWQLLGGFEWHARRHWLLFAEAKADSGNAVVHIEQGQASTDVLSFHLVAGIAWRF